MVGQDKEIWKLAEDASCNYLQNKGYVITARNYSCSFGEIDLVALKEQEIIFIEVKSRRNNMQSTFSSVSVRKRLKIIRTALHYIQENPQFENLCMRFDVVGLIYHQVSELFEIEHLPDAYRVDELEEYL